MYSAEYVHDYIENSLTIPEVMTLRNSNTKNSTLYASMCVCVCFVGRHSIYERKNPTFGVIVLRLGNFVSYNGHR